MSSMLCPKCGQDATFLNGVAICPRCDAAPQKTELPPVAAASPATSTADAFDPYHQWLGIPKSSQPANHYRLLGIQQFESNLDVIENAADRQMAHVQRSAIGPRAYLSQKLLNEIAAARLCLLNSASKATYDQQLLPSTPPALPESSPPSGPDNADTPPASYAPRKKHSAAAPSPLPKIMITVVGGIAGLAIAAFLLDQIRDQEAQRAREAVQRSQPSYQPQQRPNTPSRRKPATASRPETPPKPRPPWLPATQPPKNVSQAVPNTPNESNTPDETAANRIPKQHQDSLNSQNGESAKPSEVAQPSAPPPPSSVTNESDDKTTPTAASVTADVSPEKTETGMPELDVSRLPTVVDLPPVSSRAAEPLISTLLPHNLKITLSSDLITLDAAYSFVAKPVPAAAPRQWQIYLQKELDVGTQEAVVAELAADANGLTFRWTDDAVKLPAGQLRNCAMQLEAAGTSHQFALRTPVRAGATRVPPEKDRFRASFDVVDLPRQENLRLDVDVSYDGDRVATEAGGETTTPGKRIEFKIPQLSDAELQITLLAQQDKPLVLQVLPKQQSITGRQLTLGAEDIDELENRIRKSIIKTNNALVRAQATLKNAKSALSRAKDSATRAVLGATVDTQTKSIAIKQNNITEMQQSLKSMAILRGLVTAVQTKTLIRFRIYAESSAMQLLLVDGDYVLPSLR